MKQNTIESVLTASFKSTLVAVARGQAAQYGAFLNDHEAYAMMTNGVSKAWRSFDPARGNAEDHCKSCVRSETKDMLRGRTARREGVTDALVTERDDSDGESNAGRTAIVAGYDNAAARLEACQRIEAIKATPEGRMLIEHAMSDSDEVDGAKRVAIHRARAKLRAMGL